MIVSAASEYFETMFTTSMKEKNQKEVPLGDVSGTMLKSLIEYCYTGQFTIDAENASDALAAATMFRFVKLAAKCSDYLISNVSIESCLDTWNTATLFDLIDVARASVNFICNNFWAIVETAAFQKLGTDQLLDILNRNEVAVDSEEKIFTSIIKWIEFDAENRRKEFEKFVASIRLSEISYEVIH